MSDGVAHNGGAGTSATGEGVAAAAAAAAVPNAAQPAVPVVPATAPSSPAPVVAAAAAAGAAAQVAAVAPAAVPAAADCEPPKKKVVHKARDKDQEEEHARATDGDEDQNLSQPADGCVLPQSGQAAAAVPQDGAAAPVVVDNVGTGGGVSSGLLIGAGVLAAVGVGVLALAKGDKDEPNVPPTANADTGAVNEGASLTGSVATNDTDSNSKDVLTYALTGTAPAGLTLNSNGSYTFDANNAAYNALAVGATQVVTANYTVSDGQGGTASSTLTITVTGTNDTPVAVADTGPASTEGGAAVTGSVATNDSDPDTGATLTYTLPTAVAGLTLNSNGTYSFDPTNAAYNSLAAGQTQTVVANYRVTDAQGAFATSTLTLVVTGTNDAPVAVADVGAVNEGAVLNGSVATNDSDPDQNAVLRYTLNNPVAGLTLNTDGTFSFDANNAAYGALAAGATQVVVANYTVTDAAGATSTASLTITVTGTNDAPVGTVATAAAIEDGAIVTGQLAGTDVDTGAVLTFGLATPVAGLTVNADGSFSFDPTDPAYDSISAGQTRDVVANFTVTDAQGATSTSTLTITVTGVNDDPTIVADVAAVAEDVTITGSLRTNDSDPDTNDTLTYTVVGTAPAGLTVNADGTYSFNAANAAYQSLAVGQTQVVTATVSVTDGTSPAVNTTLTITITGTNDAPVAVADVNAGSEGAGALTGTVAANDSDVDTGAVLTYGLNAPVAGLTLNADGSYSFNLNDPAYNSLAAGQTQVVVANYTVTDAQGATSTSTLTITVTGTNDAPVATADVNAGLEDTVIAGTVATNDTDPDVGDTRTFAVLGTAPAGFVLNADGTYTLDTTNVDYQNLIAGQVRNVVVNYQVTDANGATSDSTLTIAVTGVVETANLDIDTDSSLATAQLFEAGLTDFIFTDDLAVANNAVVNSFGADDVILFGGAVSNYTFASGDFDADGVADDVSITSTVGGATSTVVLANSIAAGTSVASEADLDAAIGSGVDNFRFTVTQSLDADDDNNILTARTFDAGAESFRFVDDADVANTTVITNFGANDRIILETGNTYSFANRDADGDGNGNDLEITINKSGVVSTVLIKDIVDSDATAFTEARAEAAVNDFLGTINVDYFQFA